MGYNLSRHVRVGEPQRSKQKAAQLRSAIQQLRFTACVVHFVSHPVMQALVSTASS
jgi:hypothetical protein